MDTLLTLFLMVLKAAVFCAALMVLLMLLGVTAQVFVPMVVLLGILLGLKGVWRILTAAKQR